MVVTLYQIANTAAVVILGQTAKFTCNSQQDFLLYGTVPLPLAKLRTRT